MSSSFGLPEQHVSIGARRNHWDNKFRRNRTNGEKTPAAHRIKPIKEGIAGDINGDGTVEIFDAVTIANSFLAPPRSMKSPQPAKESIY